MRKITFLEFIGKDKKSGLLKALKDQAIAEHKNIYKGLGGGLELVISRIGTATFYHRGKRLGDVSHMTLAEAFKKVDEINAERKKKLEDDKHKDQSPLFKDSFEDWLHEKVAHLKPGSTRVANLRSLFRHTLYPLHNFKLSEITPYLVYSEISKIEQTPGNKHNAVQILSQCLTNASLKGSSCISMGKF